MNELAKRTLHEIERGFKTNKGYILSRDNPIYCPQVNGLMEICLAELGFSKEAKENCQRFLRTPSFDSKAKLFHREVDSDGDIVVPAFNSGKNAIFALALSVNGFKKQAEAIINSLRKSPLFIKKVGLFGREYDPETKEVNSLLVTQNNIWVALAYSSIGKNKEARQLMKNLESAKYDRNHRLFSSQDCRDKLSEHRFFLDDQALAILTYLIIEEKKRARALAEAILAGPLYDVESGLFNSSFSGSNVDTTKSTYKNGFMAFALGELRFDKHLKGIQEGLVRDLYDSKEKLFYQTAKDKTKVPDNSALALVALEYKNIKHKLF